MLLHISSLALAVSSWEGKLAFSLAVLQPVAPYQRIPRVERGSRRLLGSSEQMFCGRKQTTWMAARELLVYLGSDPGQEKRNAVYEILLQM